MVQPLWRIVWRFLIRLKIGLPYDPAIPLLGIYPEKTIIHKNTGTLILTTAPLTVGKDVEATKLSVNEWMKKMWCILGFPAGSVAEKLLANSGHVGLCSGLGRSTCQGALSLCSRAWELRPWSPRALEPMRRNRSSSSSEEGVAQTDSGI